MILHGETRTIQTIIVEPSEVVREMRREFLNKINRSGQTAKDGLWYDAHGSPNGTVIRSHGIIMEGLERLEELMEVKS